MTSRAWLFAVALGVSSAVGIRAGAQQAEQSSRPECVIRLQIPAYPYVARVSNSSGALRAVVTIGENGSVGSQEFELVSDPKNMKIFQPVVERAVKASRFRSSCAGQIVRLTFRFKMGAADEVWFEYPDTYEITALPLPLNRSERKK